VADVRPIYEKGDRVLVKFLTGFCAFVIQECEYREGELWFYGVSCCSMMYFPSGVCSAGRGRVPVRRGGRGLHQLVQRQGEQAYQPDGHARH
jgi:hypothetical protein